MATGVLTDFKIYEEEFFAGMNEVLEQNANLFNAASLGAMIMVPRRIKGQYEKESFFQSIASLITRRDVTSVAGVTDLKLTQDEIIGVKVNKKIGPVANTLDSFKKIAMDPSEMSFLVGQQAGIAASVDYANAAIRAVNAALSGVTALNHSATGGTITHQGLVTAMSKLGDKGQNIVAWVMHSKVFYDLVGQAITDNIFQIGSLAVMAGTTPTLGKPTIIIDSPDLHNLNGSATDTYNTLGLVQGAVEVAQSESETVVSEIVTGLENLVMRIQGEYAYNLKCKGFQWDITNGGANPTDAALATATNWDKVMADDKSLAGVRIETQ